mmetsp:Transcript_26114/g.83375  ORF Transcript_26114/g.83375 Transcript_26114/m.83375 type:complete len:305 (-) Transcript_26114:561-1475(-)
MLEHGGAGLLALEAHHVCTEGAQHRHRVGELFESHHPVGGVGLENGLDLGCGRRVEGLIEVEHEPKDFVDRHGLALGARHPFLYHSDRLGGEFRSRVREHLQNHRNDRLLGRQGERPVAKLAPEQTRVVVGHAKHRERGDGVEVSCQGPHAHGPSRFKYPRKLRKVDNQKVIALARPAGQGEDELPHLLSRKLLQAIVGQVEIRGKIREVGPQHARGVGRGHGGDDGLEDHDHSVAEFAERHDPHALVLAKCVVGTAHELLPALRAEHSALPSFVVAGRHPHHPVGIIRPELPAHFRLKVLLER